MTTIALYGGPLKRVLIQRAFGLLGQSVTEFELTPEEYDLGLQCMNEIAAEFPGISFNFPTNDDGNAADESGIASDDVRGFVSCLAQEIGPNIGKEFKPNGPQAYAMSTLRAKYTSIPFMEMGRQTIRGEGNRLFTFGRPFFVTDLSPDEVQQ